MLSRKKPPPSPINFLDEEIPFDQLLNLDGDEIEGQNEVILGDQAQMEEADNVQVQSPAQEVQSPPQSPAQEIQSPAQEIQEIQSPVQEAAQIQSRAQEEAHQVQTLEVGPGQGTQVQILSPEQESSIHRNQNLSMVQGVVDSRINLTYQSSAKDKGPHSKGKTVTLNVAISGDWAPFFNSLLLSSDTKEWAT